MKTQDKNEIESKNVLILEDEPLMNELVVHYCKSLPFPVDIKSYQDPLSALRDPRLDQGSIDLMVVDMLLPEMNAYEFLENVRTRSGDHFPSILAITAIANDQLILKLKETFGVKLLRKPFKKRDFLDAALEAITLQKAS